VQTSIQPDISNSIHDKEAKKAAKKAKKLKKEKKNKQ
jgi:hypothetical protein